MSFYGPRRDARLIGPKFFTGSKDDNAVVKDVVRYAVTQRCMAH